MKKETLYEINTGRVYEGIPGWEMTPEGDQLSRLPLSKLMKALLKPDREGEIL